MRPETRMSFVYPVSVSSRLAVLNNRRRIRAHLFSESRRVTKPPLQE
jgi:hypothetical protein